MCQLEHTAAQVRDGHDEGFVKLWVLQNADHHPSCRGGQVRCFLPSDQSCATGLEPCLNGPVGIAKYFLIARNTHWTGPCTKPDPEQDKRLFSVDEVRCTSVRSSPVRSCCKALTGPLIRFVSVCIPGSPGPVRSSKSGTTVRIPF